MNMDELTSIKLRRETREKLKNLGRKGESYDQIINKLIEFYLERCNVNA
jgi:predicted DNA-binding protein